MNNSLFGFPGVKMECSSLGIAILPDSIRVHADRIDWRRLRFHCDFTVPESEVFQNCFSNPLIFGLQKNVMDGTVTILPTCLTCGKPLRGRSDKKFCGAGCKNDYSNRLQREERMAMNSIDLILKCNRRVLKRCLGDHPTRLVYARVLTKK